MSEKDAHHAPTLGAVAATNIKRWRVARGLDQQGLADRLAAIGHPTDRTTITRIERGDRKVTVDDLGRFAVALHVPMTLLLIPLFEGGDVKLTERHTVNRWVAWEWMIGNTHPTPLDRATSMEWFRGAEPLWLYERAAQAQLRAPQREHSVGEEPAEWVTALQELVDAVETMEALGWPARDLLGDRVGAIDHHRIQPRLTPRARVGEGASQ